MYGTDGETAMEIGFEKNFPIESVAVAQTNVHLRCFTHFETDIERFCKREGISAETTKEIIYVILGSERDGIRTAGLVDADNDELFERQY